MFCPAFYVNRIPAWLKYKHNTQYINVIIYILRIKNVNHNLHVDSPECTVNLALTERQYASITFNMIASSSNCLSSTSDNTFGNMDIHMMEYILHSSTVQLSYLYHVVIMINPN